MDDETPRPSFGRHAAAFAVTAVLFTANAALTWWSVVDDAYISARYSDHLADGFGVVYNAGEPAVEGVTNLAWTFLVAATRVVGIPAVWSMTTLGWVFGLLALLASAGLTKALIGRDTLLQWVPALVLAIWPHWAVSATNGLESTMMTAAVLGTLWAFLSLGTPHRHWAGLLAVGLVWTRPEGLVPAAFVVLLDLWRARGSWRAALPVSGTVAAGTLLLFAWRILTYGDVVPNTFHAKSSFPLLNTFQVNRVYLMPERELLLVTLALWLLATLARPRSADKALVSLTALALGAIPLTVNLWMPGLRLFLTPVALTLVLVTAWAGRGGPLRQRGVAGLLVAGMLAFHVGNGERIRYYDWRHSVEPANGAQLAAEHLAAHAPEDAWLATRDAGVLAYFVGTGVKVSELHHRALTQPHPNNDNADILSYTPTNPAFFASTVRREGRETFDYSNDRMVFDRFTRPYRYLGRVHQHYHRYYDIYVRADLDVPDLPKELVVNFKGVKPRITERAVPKGAPAPLPDTGL